MFVRSIDHEAIILNTFSLKSILAVSLQPTNPTVLVSIISSTVKV